MSLPVPESTEGGAATQSLERQLLLLLEASSSLIAVPKSTEVLSTIVRLAQRFIQADAYAIWRELQDHRWVLSSHEGLSEEFLSSGAVSSTGPVDLTATAIIIEDVRGEPLLERRLPALTQEGINSMLIIPLIMRGQATGTIVFYWKAHHRVTEAEARIATIIGNLAASALGTAELYEHQLESREQAQAAERRAAFLSQAGVILASSLDYEDTLASVARLAVPTFADWAAVDILDNDGSMKRVAVTHSDPQKVRLAYEFSRRYPPNEQEASRIALRTGKSIMMDLIPDQLIEQRARDTEHAKAIRELGLKSFIIAPMIHGAQTVGTITFATAESGRIYQAVDLQTAEELARRAAIAVENARLHRDVRRSEERYRAILETTPECVKMIASDGTVLDMNKPGLTMLGADKREDIIGKSVYEVVAPEFRDSFRAFNEAVCGGAKGFLEFDLIGLSGHRRHMETHAVPFREADGKAVHLGITRDITERRQAERARLLLGAIVDSSDDAIISKDLDGIITSWNTSARRIFGYSSEEAIGQPVAKLLIPADRQDEEPQILARLRQGERVDHFETVRRRKDGTLLDVSLTISPVKNARGTIVGASKIARDITDRKRAEEALRMSEARFRQVADTMPQLVWTARPDGFVDYYNERWYEYTGFSRDAFGDSSWSPILHPEDVERTHETYYAAIHSGEPYNIEYRLFDRKARRWRWFVGRAIPVRDDHGEIVKWFGTCTDIDQQKQVQEDLLRANADLEQFAFSASHDLQEPLRSINIYSELLVARHSETLNSDAQTFLSYIQANATRMETMVRDLLTYTQVTRLEVPGETVDANEALNTALANLASVISETGAKITADLLPALAVHDTHLQQIFQNLIGNAIKYRSPERKPIVHVAAEQQNGHWRLSVSDNGIGIDPAYTTTIFGLFKRLHTREEYAGTGIGLAICQRIVDRYQGRIWVKSEYGRGSTFFLTLPA